ncbi:Shedu anti-phage system protein SduA domain-containing protein [uncultured Pseudonocardia sp.]|uniref:Shedu anti-phage system protein SduA domain-containing protein n=1 Tax=uncultured Pseudonocardia sp. TaxID=211455 RepID=UPI00260F5525|nr:Shedu anti-phage system protein SduA domain-containing protein [uncultured Pseudonocardia sp.]
MSSSDDEGLVSPEDAFRIWVNPPRGRTLRNTGAVLKPGPEVMKTVTLGHYGSQRTGEVRNRTLRFRSHDLRGNRDIDFDDDQADKASWHCEGEEIEKLLAFLHSDVARTGRYQVVDVDSPGAALLELLENDEVDAQGLADALVRHADVGQIVSLLTTSHTGLAAAQAAVIEQRRQLVAQLRTLIDGGSSTETDVQRLIGTAHWIFGGRYVGVAVRRSLTMLDQHDIPLLSSDGTLHIVELKGPTVDNLILWHRNHWIAGGEVHKAVSQAQSYLRSLDEQGLGLSKMYENELGQHYDMSRVFATVVIGHSDHDRPDKVGGLGKVDREIVARTLRQYNAGLNRVEVVTYDQLVESAERALVFETDSKDAQTRTLASEAEEPEPRNL